MILCKRRTYYFVIISFIICKSLGADNSGTLLSLKQVLKMTLANNPKLNAITYEINKAKAKGLQESLIFNPRVSFEIENFAESGNFGDFSAYEGTLLLSQEIQLGNKRGNRKKVYQIEEQLINWKSKIIEMDTINDVTQVFFDLLGAQEIVKFSEELLKLANEIYRITKEKIKAGKISSLELLKANINITTQKTRYKNSKTLLFVLQKRLKSFLISEDSAPITAKGDLFLFMPLLTLDELQKKTFNNPDIAKWNIEKERRRAIRDLEKSKKFPNFEIGAGLKKLKDQEGHAYVMKFSMPITLFDRNQGNIKEAAQNLTQVDYEKIESTVGIENKLTHAYFQARTAFNEATALKNDTIPDAKKVFRSIKDGYQLGKFTYLELLNAQHAYYESKSQYLHSLATYHKATAQIERLIGGHSSKVIAHQEKEKLK